MKSLLLAIFVLTAGAAQAEVKVPGTFVPSLCSIDRDRSISTEIVKVKKVCFGEIAGFDKKAVELYLNSGESRLYSIELKSSIKGNRGMGVSRVIFKGGLAVLRMHDPIVGELVTTSGIRTSHNISLKTSTNLKFSGALEPVFVTQ